MSFFRPPRSDLEPLSTSRRHRIWAVAIISMLIVFLISLTKPTPGSFLFILAIVPFFAAILSFWLLFANFINYHQSIPHSPYSEQREECVDHFTKTLFIGGTITIAILSAIALLMMPFLK